MTGIICVSYNKPEFVIRQYEHLKMFCTDDYELIVVDNSTEKEAIEAIKWYANNKRLKYLKTNATSLNGSDSHAFAVNVAYQKYKSEYDILFMADHDLFSIKPFSCTEILKDKSLAGLGQQRNGVKYYWPGAFMFKTDIPIEWQMIPGYDTGGATQKAIQSVGEENCVFFNEEYCQNPGFNKPPYSFYALIHNGTFLHFINGSNWAKSEMNEERLNSLFNLLTNYVEQNKELG